MGGPPRQAAAAPTLLLPSIQVNMRAGKLPPDTDGRVPATLVISFRPKD